MVLIFSTLNSAARRSKAEKILLRKSIVRSGVSPSLSVVNPTTSQNRIVAAATWSAMAVSHAVDDALRQDVQQQGFRTLLFPFQVGDEFLLPVAEPFPLQRRADARAQQDRIERLRQIILRAGFDATHRTVEIVER
jgi:hypothetical protein